MEELKKELAKAKKEIEKAKIESEKYKQQIEALTKQVESTKLQVSEEEGEDQTKFSYHTKPPKMLKGCSFINYCDKFKAYCKMTGFKTNLDLLFLQNIDSDTYTELKLPAKSLSSFQKKDAEEICRVFTEAIYGEESISLRNELLNLKQKATETISEFCNRIQEAASMAYSSPDQAQEACLLTLLRGVSDDSIKQKLNEATITEYSQAIRLAKKLESVTAMLQKEPSTILKNSAETRFADSSNPHQEQSRWRSDTPYRSQNRNYNSSDSRERDSYYYRSSSRSREPDQRNRVPRSSRD